MAQPSTAWSAVRLALVLCAVLLTAVVGILLATDRPGLEAHYFALSEPWQGEPIFKRHAPLRLVSEEDEDALRSRVLFSIRWSGWWNVSESGRHRFTISADDGGYLRIDDELVVDSRTTPSKRQWSGRRELAAGFHRIEVGYYQASGSGHFTLTHGGPGRDSPRSQELSAASLYSTRPLGARRLLRDLLSSWARPYRQVLGAAFLLASLLLIGRAVGHARWWIPLASRCKRAVEGSRGRSALLLLLFALAFWWSLPLAGGIRGGDDVEYLNAARFNETSWFFNRYGHVYLLKLFIGVGGGDPLLGLRLWWSFVFATTAGSIAVAVASVGRGLQSRTLAVTVFILLAQPSLFGLIGAFADYSAMMFMTAAVAVAFHFLLQSAEPRGRNPVDWHAHWHALAIGALTVAAMRSKEVGAVLLLLPLLFILQARHPEEGMRWRRVGRQVAAWTVGAGAVLVVFVVLDGFILGDPLFTFDGGRFATSGSINFPDTISPRKPTETWLHAVLKPGGHASTSAMRYLWLGVAASAIVAGCQRRSLSRRLLHLLPIVYFLALIVLYTRMPHPFSSRMMVPILPVACLMTGLLAHYAGLDTVAWKRLTRPGLLVPGVLAGALWWLVVVPLETGEVDVAALLPTALLARFGWDPGAFASGMLAPAVALAAVGLGTLLLGRRSTRVMAVVLILLAAFATGFAFNRLYLARHETKQKSDLLLYPWRTFAQELERIQPQTIALSTDLHARYGMAAGRRSSIARFALDRQDLKLSLTRRIPRDADVAIASRDVYRQWRRQLPALSRSAANDPRGLLVLVRPAQALALPARPETEPEPETPGE